MLALAKPSISIHAPLTGSDEFVMTFRFPDGISIHAPLTGSDLDLVDVLETPKWISIHAPLTGSDIYPIPNLAPTEPFQSTLPLRGATMVPSPLRGGHHNFNPRSPYGERRLSLCLRDSVHYFNPRSPYGERLQVIVDGGEDAVISIHAPLTGSDLHPTCWSKSRAIISIHAPLTGSDLGRPVCFLTPCDFNPRSPYGERPFPQPSV